MQTQPKYTQKRELSYAVNSLPDKKVTKVTILTCPNIQETIEKYCQQALVHPIIHLLCQLDGDIDSLYPGITGKARCLESDEFDVLKGEQIAICKAEIKYREKMNRMYKRFIKRLQITICELEKLVERNKKTISVSEGELDYLCGEPNKQKN